MTEKWVPDCHDSGCRYAKTRGGMRTQGGKCRCMERAMDVIEAADRLAERLEASLGYLDQEGHEMGCFDDREHPRCAKGCDYRAAKEYLAAYSKVRG